MNKQRRTRIEKIAASLAELQSDIELVRDDEWEAFDNLPEGLQESERGDRMQEVIDCLEEAISNIDEAIENLNTAAE
jgi:prefoldin subunit 5